MQDFQKFSQEILLHNTHTHTPTSTIKEHELIKFIENLFLASSQNVFTFNNMQLGVPQRFPCLCKP